MILTLYFSKRQIQALSVDVETMVLNDLDEKFHNMAILAMQDPSIDKYEYTNKKEVAFSFYILCMCAHAYAMRQRRVLDDNEWAGWLQWMKNCFQRGVINEVWRHTFHISLLGSIGITEKTSIIFLSGCVRPII